jgi:hypothetical protein
MSPFAKRREASAVGAKHVTLGRGEAARYSDGASAVGAKHVTLGRGEAARCRVSAR